ncbi:hypothetical protein AVEN_108937-1 [Araneus ventricosus]|uniref:Uncharacterized protein n=1 Tax=Araneus ventricosus TaxID=182803 RepID=A0A4Y2ESZ6_ARAVE|nr:hypothetical protein AVEN_108937-1 [Araneus ventricosus]
MGHRSEQVPQREVLVKTPTKGAGFQSGASGQLFSGRDEKDQYSIKTLHARARNREYFFGSGPSSPESLAVQNVTAPIHDGGIGNRAGNPPAPKPRPYHQGHRGQVDRGKIFMVSRNPSKSRGLLRYESTADNSFQSVTPNSLHASMQSRHCCTTPSCLRNIFTFGGDVWSRSL